MPLVVRQVTPVRLSNGCINGPDNELENVTNNTLVETLKQLASVAQFADDIFGRVYSECRLVNDRCSAIGSSLNRLSEAVQQLDPKTVDIPEGDLDSCFAAKTHFKGIAEGEEKKNSQNMFVVESRSKSLQKSYQSVAEDPELVLRIMNQYRSGCRFNLPDPYSKKKPNMCMDIEIRKPASVLKAFLKMSSGKVEDFSDGFEDTDVESLNTSTETLTPSPKLLPSPEEKTKATAEAFPALTVPIDVTGSGFKRMANFRRSLLQITFHDVKRKKKGKKRSKRRNTICEGDVTVNRPSVQDALTQTDGESAPLRTKRRSLFSLRRKSANDTLDDSSECVFSADEAGTSTSPDMSYKRSVHVTSSSQTDDPDTLPSPIEKPSRTSRFLDGFLRASRNRLHKISSSDKAIAPSSAEKKTKRCSVIPISTISQAMGLAVKLRDNSKSSKGGDGEDRNSSSGNWSATSSTRTSFDSDTVQVNANKHRKSSPDEALTEYTSDSTAAGTSTVSSFSFHPEKRCESRTTSWLRNHSHNNLDTSIEDHVSEGETTPLVLSPFTTRRTKKVVDDGSDDSSVYSVDTDGYYTSMHTDSGLRSATNGDFREKSDLEISNADTICIRKKATPPVPPKRTSSRPNSFVDENRAKSEESTTSTPSSESDREEAGLRLKTKTTISSVRYPPMVHVSESEDDPFVHSKAIDIRDITYPAATGRLQRPNTLNLKKRGISENDVPMLGFCKSPVPALYCDSLLKKKSWLKRSQSVKQEAKSPPPLPKNSPTRLDPNYSSNSLGRRRGKCPNVVQNGMTVESTVAAQLPMSKKYSTLPTRMRHYPSPLAASSPIRANQTIRSGSLDRRMLKTYQNGRKENSHALSPVAPRAIKVSPPVPPKPKKATMTIEDLYSAIHSSKRRMNIKTDPSPMSSRCTSPSIGRVSNSSSRAGTPSCASPTPSIISNGSSVLAETGFLSPRNGTRNSPGDRQSWAPGNNQPKSYACDRLRSSVRKPTSLTDFKKLLLQTKTSSMHARSATEILRATSPSQRSSPSTPSSNNHFRPITPTPNPASRYANSPFKRGNRLRASLPVNNGSDVINSPIYEDEHDSNAVLQSSARNRQASSAMFGYLTRYNPKCSTAKNVLHIPTRSALESSV